MSIWILLIVMEITCFGFTRSLEKSHYKGEEWNMKNVPLIIGLVLLLTYLVAFLFSFPLQVIHTLIGNLQKES